MPLVEKVRDTLVVGDVHACAAELAELLSLAGGCELVLVGDLFTKGPDPVGVWEIISSTGARAVLGNHDAWMLAHPEKAATMGLPAEAWDWLGKLPLHLRVADPKGGEILVVHAGVHPELGLSGTSRWGLLHMRRWPDDTDPGHPFWWQRYAGVERVLYGHDAVRGLQDHRPLTLGLDSGCVYGNRLTGYLVGADRLLSVPARAAYRPPEPYPGRKVSET